MDGAVELMRELQLVDGGTSEPAEGIDSDVVGQAAEARDPPEPDAGIASELAATAAGAIDPPDPFPWARAIASSDALILRSRELAATAAGSIGPPEPFPWAWAIASARSKSSV